jgi:hypothetical protein
MTEASSSFIFSSRRPTRTPVGRHEPALCFELVPIIDICRVTTLRLYPYPSLYCNFRFARGMASNRARRQRGAIEGRPFVQPGKAQPYRTAGGIAAGNGEPQYHGLNLNI